jgi:hypothetical protein
MSETHRTLVTRLLVAGLLVVALLARLVPGERLVDDAYITFRYAHNLVEGFGFVYNPGERVLGTTTPLYALLLAGLALATGSRDFAALALAVNALAGAASVGLLYALGNRFAGHRAPAVAAALLWAVAPYSVTFAIGGMETDLAVALLLAASYAHVAGRPRAMAALSALALLARPDTAILLGLLWLDLALTQLWKRQLVGVLREGLIALALLLPWLVFGTLYFGSPFTNSVAAKSVTYRLNPTEGLVRLIQHYSTPFFEDAAFGPPWRLIGFAVYLLLCGVGGLRVIRRNRRAWPLLAYPYLYLAVFAAANPLLFRWYLSPPLPFYFLLITTGIWVLARDLGRLLSNLKPFGLSRSAERVSTEVDEVSRRSLRPKPGTLKLETVALTLLFLFTTLCAGDIGVLGYRTRMHVLDTVGLVTPESTRHYPADPGIYAINYAIPADLVLALDPDYVVILEVYGRRGLLPDPRFRARYQLLEKVETDIYGANGMLIFERRP